jgi:tetratricopeptide (TPR) repeat protein
MSLDLRYFNSMSSLLLVIATVAIAQPSYRREAIADYSHAIQISSEEYADAYYNRGLVYQELQQYPESLSDLNRAIELGLEDAIPVRDEVLRLLQ